MTFVVQNVDIRIDHNTTHFFIVSSLFLHFLIRFLNFCDALISLRYLPNAYEPQSLKFVNAQYDSVVKPTAYCKTIPKAKP